MQPPIPVGPPCSFNHTVGGYWEACGGAAGNIGEFSGLTRAQAQDACCKNAACAGFSFEPDASGNTGGGYYKGNAMCGFTQDSGAEGFTKVGQVPPSGGVAQDITISFADINLVSPVVVYDIWAQQSLGSFTGSFTAKAVPCKCQAERPEIRKLLLTRPHPPARATQTFIIPAQTTALPSSACPARRRPSRRACVRLGESGKGENVIFFD